MRLWILLCTATLFRHNPTANLSKEFDNPTVEHFKTIRPEDLPEFLMTLNRAQIKLQTRYLILWQLLTMTRPNEAAMARYEDIDEKSKIWTIYIQKGIKQDERGREHKITLSRQAMALLKEIKKLSGGKEYLFQVKEIQNRIPTRKPLMLRLNVWAITENSLLTD